jgi:hypothetical protein
MYDDINLFLNCTSTVFIILGVWNILDNRNKISNNGLFLTMWIINLQKQFDIINKAITVPPPYEEPDSLISEGDVSDQIPYIPLNGQFPSFSSLVTTTIDVNEID